jgi:hypothetical protein
MFGQGIWLFHRPRRYALLKRLPFHDALYSGRTRLINFGSALPYSEQAALRSLITAVVKHTENILREQRGFRGRLRSYQLPDQLADMINQSLLGVGKRKPVQRKTHLTIDLAKVQSLTEQSDEIRELLLSLSEESSSAAPPSPTAVEKSTVSDEKQAWPLQLRARLGQTELSLLQTLALGPGAQNDEMLVRAADGHLLEPLIDRINAVALDVLGDLLISTENGVRLISEAYRSELLEAPQELTAPAKTRGLPELESEWLAFYTTLAPEELPALALLAEAGGPSEWQQFCLSIGRLPQVLVDSINDKALDTIGDLLLDALPTAASVMPEYQPLVLKLLEYWRGEQKDGG